MKYPSSVNSSRLYHRYFSSLGGVDVTSDPAEVSLSRFADMTNMWRDPKIPGSEVTETFPGYYGMHFFEKPLHAVYRHRTVGEDYLLVHAGERLYRFPETMRHFPRLIADLAPLPVTVPSVKGTSFALGEDLYLLIGGKCLRIDKEGEVYLFGAEGVAPYVPTTYYDGKPYEQRNLLTDKVNHVFSVNAGTYDGRTKVGISYVIVNEEERLCHAKATSNLTASTASIPATVRIGERDYTVTGIASFGFSALVDLTEIVLPSSLTFLGEGAFSGCTNLRTVIIPDGVISVSASAFHGCTALSTLYIGRWVARIGPSAFADCPLQRVYYAANKQGADAIVTEDEIPFPTNPSLYYEKGKPEDYCGHFRFPIMEKHKTLLSISVDGKVLPSSFTLSGADGKYRLHTEAGVTYLCLFISDKRVIDGKPLSLTLTAEGGGFTLPERHIPFATEAESGKEAVFGCRVVTAFDGRLFFTGNPLFPNTVFYSAPDNTGYNNPFYVGVLNYFNDGVGKTPNLALLSLGDRLAVIKEDAMGEGEIFLHAPYTTGEDLIPRIYPVSSGLTGLGILGEPITFGGEHLILTKKGLMALSPAYEEGRYTLLPRSSAINKRLCKENLSKARMAVHEGVLYLLVSGHVYLGYDTGKTEYEWFLLTGIGCYKGGAPVMRYSDRLPAEAAAAFPRITIHERVGEITESTLYSMVLSDNTFFYYVTEDGVSYPVDNDGEYTGGEFFPATLLCATEENLYFATEEGGLSCFHTDKRGKAAYLAIPSPLYVAMGSEYRPLNTAPLRAVPEEAVLHSCLLYRKAGSNYYFVRTGSIYRDSKACLALAVATGEAPSEGRIHSLFYTFDGRRYPSFLLLAPDDGGLPHYRKDTLTRSATVKCKASGGEAPTVLVRTDRHPFRPCDKVGAGIFDFADMDFSALDFHGDEYATLSVREKERGWSYKQYLFSAEGFRAPFGLHSLTYSYYTAGRPKP